MMNLPEAEQVRLVEQGMKPVAVVDAGISSELSFIPLATYTCVLDPDTDVITRVITNRERIYYQPAHQVSARSVFQLMNRPAPRVGDPAPPPPPAHWHRELGRLLGYSEAEVDGFLSS